ncbi:MAG TPA: hypothetical protein VIZ58_10410 [Thermoanaerobaculia bacterium]
MKDLPRAGNAILLAGAAVLLGIGAARLPVPRELLRRPATPFDRSDAPAAPAFRLLSRAAGVVPAGAVAAVRAQPRNAADETMLHFLGVALLPGRRVLPAAAWSQFTPEYEAQAEYIVVVGPAPPAGYGAAERLRLLDSDPSGTVWKRASP